MNIELQDFNTINYYNISSKITVKYQKINETKEKLKKISMYIFIICSVIVDITMIVMQNVGIENNKKCQNPDSGRYFGNPISIQTFIMFFSIAKLVFVAILSGLLVKRSQNNSFKIRLILIYIWCFFTVAAGIGLILFFNSSIPKECFSSKSGYLLIIWIIIHSLFGIPVFIVIILWNLCLGSLDLIRQYLSTLIICLILLANFTLDWLPFFAVIEKWSINECRNYGIRGFLLFCWISKLIWRMFISNKSIRPVCFWFQFLLGLSGLILYASLGISNPCTGSNLGTFILIWCSIQIIIAIIMRIIFIYKNHASESYPISNYIRDIIKEFIVCLIVLLILGIPVLSLVGYYNVRRPTSYNEFTINPIISFDEYLLITGWLDIAFIFCAVSIIIISAIYTFDYWISVAFTMAISYSVYSIIIGSIGAVISLYYYDSTGVHQGCLSSSFIGIMVSINFYYHIICGSLAFVISWLTACCAGRPIVHRVSKGLIFIWIIVLLLNALIAIIHASISINNSFQLHECPVLFIAIFLIIGGSIQIIMVIFLCIALQDMDRNYGDTNCFSNYASCLACLILIWSVFGLAIHGNEKILSLDCSRQKLPLHMVIYSGINLVIFGLSVINQFCCFRI